MCPGVAGAGVLALAHFYAGDFKSSCVIAGALSFAVLPSEVAEGSSYASLSGQNRNGHFTERDMVTHYLT